MGKYQSAARFRLAFVPEILYKEKANRCPAPYTLAERNKGSRAISRGPRPLYGEGQIDLRFINPLRTNRTAKICGLVPTDMPMAGDKGKGFFPVFGPETAALLYYSPWYCSGIERIIRYGSLNCSSSLGALVTGMPPTRELGTKRKRTTSKMREKTKGGRVFL